MPPEKTACRQVLFVQNGQRDPRDAAANAGLLLDCYLESFANAADRHRLLNQARTACRRSQPLYKKAFQRWKQSLPPGTLHQTVLTQGRFITGLGAATTLETGIRLHPAYGVPFIPGSGLKGLAAHYCARVWKERDPRFAQDGPIYRTLFGTTDESGLIQFHDAWIDPADLAGEKGGLVSDVMTPHHPDYLKGKAPTDFDSPIPVTFLSVSGSFLLALTPVIEDANSSTWTRLALDLLLEAMKDWGAGTKTRSGYGRLAPQANS